MKHAVALLLCVSGVLAQSAAVVEGTVTDSVTHAGVPGVSVTLWTNRGSYKATTDPAGMFVMSNVNPGEYYYRFEKDGYETREWPVFGQLKLRVGNAGTFHADGEIAALATLRGRVLDADGKPAAKIKVEINGDSQETDANGDFEFHKVRPGDYTLKAIPPTDTSGAVQPVPTFYPSTINSSEAEHIQVRAGSDLAGYEIRLRTSSVYQVHGIVFGEDGKPEAGANVRLLASGDGRLLSGITMNMGTGTRMYWNLQNALQQESATVSAKDGAFALTARPGQWKLQAELDPAHDAHNNLYQVSSNIVPLSVSDRDIDNIELRFSAPFTLEITADWGDRAPAGDRRPRVMVTPADGLFLAPARPQNDKLVLEHMLPGRYRIAPIPGSTPGFYASAVMVAGRNVLGQEVELTAATPSIQVVYKPNPGSVRGTVDQGEGATVLLWPEGPDIPEFVPAVVAGSRGEFGFSGIAPGEYVLVAFGRIPPDGGTETFVRGAVAAGTRVQVQEGGSESVEIPVTRWPE